MLLVKSGMKMKERIFIINIFLAAAVLVTFVGGNSEDDVCFRCGGRKGECLDSHRVCDNFIDCEDATDESTAAGGRCFMKKVCENNFTERDESFQKSVVLYSLAAVVTIESIVIFVVALCVTLRRRKSAVTPCTHTNCKDCKTKKRHGPPVFTTNVNIYELRRKRSDQDLLTGPAPYYVEATASGGGEIVTRHPLIGMEGFPLKYSKDVRYFECTPTRAKDSIHFETPPKEKIYEEIGR